MSGNDQDRRGAILVEIARASLVRELGGTVEPSEPEGRDEPWLSEPGATFVTLRKGGDLRGCVGSIEPTRPLVEDVRRNAVAAALRDPRFPPLAPGELAEIEVEVTLLSPLEPMSFTSEGDALARLRPGEDGVLLLWGRRRATFLPQVWEVLPEPAEFLASLKRKAGLAPDFWDGDVELFRYTARHWCESELAAARSG